MDKYLRKFNLLSLRKMEKKASIRPNDLLAIIVVVIGGLGFLLWGLGISTVGNPTLRWLGSIIVALIGLMIAILERWLK